MEISETVKNIKKELRLYMNGVTASSMRSKGADYKISWGASIMHLREMASDYEPSYSLALELWKSEVRECKILATMLMPPADIDRQTVNVWMEQVSSLEIAEQLVLNLLQHVRFAPQLAYEWLSSDRDLYLIAGYNLLGRLFMQQETPNERGINEYLDQLMVALGSSNPNVQKAAMNSCVRFAQLGEEYAQVAKSALRQNNYDFL